MLLHGRGKEMQCLRVDLARRGINMPLISPNVLVYIHISHLLKTYVVNLSNIPQTK